MNPVSRFEGAEFAPNSPTDAPVSVATITVYRKGAQVAENVMFLEQETHDLAVEDAGDIVRTSEENWMALAFVSELP